MRIAVVGTGYVGLVTGTCFADSGNHVTCIDVDEEKIEGLKRGEIPIYEPGLAEMVERNAAAGRLSFSTDLAAAVKPAELVYLAVGTPQAQNGAADLTALRKVVQDIAPVLSERAVVVIKSTVPVGTNCEVHQTLCKLTGREVDVASNPEFLKEGAALDDFTKPDRVVVGVRRPEVAEVLQQLFDPFLRTDHPFLVMSPESAELTKYIANAMLATKISFINEMANLCETLGGDINDVRRGIGHDARIGFAFLFPGAGYGGSCFPKDVRALHHTAQQAGFESLILPTIDRINERQKSVLLAKMEKYYGDELQGKTVAVWGLAFKPRTDDIREAPALVLVDALLAAGVKLQVHDPEAMDNVERRYKEKLIYCHHPMDALNGARALAIVTEWTEFRNPDFAEMRRRMQTPVIFDGRNLYKRHQMQAAGFDYFSIGRPDVPRQRKSVTRLSMLRCNDARHWRASRQWHTYFSLSQEERVQFFSEPRVIQRVGGHQVGIAFHPAISAVHPRAVGLLPGGQLRDHLGPPVVLLAVAVAEGVLPVGRQGLGQGVVVVEQAGPDPCRDFPSAS